MSDSLRNAFHAKLAVMSLGRSFAWGANSYREHYDRLEGVKLLDAHRDGRYGITFTSTDMETAVAEAQGRFERMREVFAEQLRLLRLLAEYLQEHHPAVAERLDIIDVDAPTWDIQQEPFDDDTFNRELKIVRRTLTMELRKEVTFPNRPALYRKLGVTHATFHRYVNAGIIPERFRPKGQRKITVTLGDLYYLENKLSMPRKKIVAKPFPRSR
jgi:hypothetical protein